MLSKRPMQVHESLTRAIELEDDHIYLLRRWSLRFRPFDPQVVYMLGQLVRESEGHRGHLLYHASRYLDWHHRPKSRADRVEATDSDHFFIVSGQAAEEALESICCQFDDAKRFYRSCGTLDEVKGTSLGSLFQNLSGFKEIQIQILKEVRERCRYRALHKFLQADTTVSLQRLINTRRSWQRGGQPVPHRSAHPGAAR